MGYEAKRGLREGVTTGACAAAAAKAAALALIAGESPDRVEVSGPDGRVFSLEVMHMGRSRCGVVKDAGDDSDATDGMTVIAEVTLDSEPGEIRFEAGEGVGTVTLRGLKVPPGEPAINPGPRKMITQALREAVGALGATVTISVPGGAELAKRTFNPKLGVAGGISILGTTGVVKPLNEQSIFDSLTLELETHAAENRKALLFTPGSSGEAAARGAFGITGRVVVQIGNYLGYLLDEAARLDIRKILLCGHPGKLLKVAAGSFNTHNRVADGRLEALCAQAAIAGAPPRVVKSIYDCRTTEQAMEIISRRKLGFLWQRLADITASRCTGRMFGEVIVRAAYIVDDGTILGMSAGARQYAEELAHEK